MTENNIFKIAIQIFRSTGIYIIRVVLEKKYSKICENGIARSLGKIQSWLGYCLKRYGILSFSEMKVFCFKQDSMIGSSIFTNFTVLINLGKYACRNTCK